MGLLGVSGHISDFVYTIADRPRSLSRETTNEDRAAKEWASTANCWFSVSADATTPFTKRDNHLDDSTLAMERSAARRLRRGLRAARRAAEASAGADVRRTAAHET